MNILDIKNQVVAEVPKDPNLFIELHMVEAVKDLCKASKAYTEVLTDVSVIDQAVYPLVSTIANTSIVTLLDGTYAACDLQISTIQEQVLYDRRWETREGSPTSFIYRGGKSVQLNRIPNVAGDAMTFKIAIMPLKMSSALPEVIELGYIEAIKNYVKWKIYISPRLYDERKALKFQLEYEEQRDSLKAETLTDHSNSYQVQFEGFTK